MELDGGEGTGESTREVAQEKQRAPIQVYVIERTFNNHWGGGKNQIYIHMQGSVPWQESEPSE